HTIVKSGSTEGNAMDTANILKPYLLKGSFKCIGATTYEEYKKYLEKDKALSRRFQKIEVEEPTVDEAKQIIKNLIYYYENFHSVKYTEGAIDKAVELSHHYIKDRFLPDKALDIIDEAGAYVKLKEEEKIVKEKHIKKIVTSISRIKIEETKKDDISSLSALANNLKKEIYGQDEAIERVVQIIKTSKAGLTEKTKPIGSFLFCGPTGVGKTELAKRLAHHMQMNFLRFDMSEYMEKHAVAKLIGSPPGYVGYDEGGQLIEQVKRNPYSVLLLDEIEKAHPDIYNILLQVMDYATLTDNAGRKADFRNCIIIMTTNAGAREINSNNIGFLEKTENNRNTQNAIKSVFSPEFRNRLDYIITFNKLDIEEIKRIVRKFISELNTMLDEKGVRVRITDRAAEYLAEKGFDKTMGARPIKRLINEQIKVKLSDEILFGRLKNGGSVIIDYDKEICFVVDER
ncbi:MAG: AAA family ATPase, partial [Deferribacterota bacterium]|nr:AAA family ATPase [Deferribacterota bacterium]